MKHKLILIYTAMVTSVMFLNGCDNSRTADINLGDSYIETTNTTQETTITSEATTTQRELTISEKLDNTCWVGSNGNQNIMSITFNDDEVTVSTMSESGYQNDITGYWDVDDEKVTVYSDKALTEQITYYDYILSEFDNGDSFLYMEGMYLSLMDSNSMEFESICEDMSQSFDTFSYIADGSFWVGNNHQDVDFFVCNYGDIYFYIASIDSSNTSYFDGKWGLTYDTFYIIDNETSNFTYFKWSFEEDTSTLYLTDIDGNIIEFAQTDATNFNEVMVIVNSHLDGTYEEITTTQETTTEETTLTENVETSISYDNSDNSFDDDDADNADYDDSKEYYDTYTKPVTTTTSYYYETEPYQDETYSYTYDDSYGYDSYDYNSG